MEISEFYKEREKLLYKLIESNGYMEVLKMELQHEIFKAAEYKRLLNTKYAIKFSMSRIKKIRNRK